MFVSTGFNKAPFSKIQRNSSYGWLESIKFQIRGTEVSGQCLLLVATALSVTSIPVPY